jgi:hypothetical protein
METLTSMRADITTGVIDHRNARLGDLASVVGDSKPASRALPGQGAGRVAVADFQSSI